LRYARHAKERIDVQAEFFKHDIEGRLLSAVGPRDSCA